MRPLTSGSAGPTRPRWRRREPGVPFSDPDGIRLELVTDDDDEPRIAVAADIREEAAIRGLRGVRPYSGDSGSSARILAEVLGMASIDKRTWLARTEPRRSVYGRDPGFGKARLDGCGVIRSVAAGRG